MHLMWTRAIVTLHLSAIEASPVPDSNIMTPSRADQGSVTETDHISTLLLLFVVRVGKVGSARHSHLKPLRQS